MGGRDFFSNGIHLNVIEAADDAATESWRNLLAIDDVVREIVETDSHLVISALAGDAAAGGVPFALAADYAVAREDVVLNPYYRHMGGLYGSEYWTYLLPRRIGHDLADELDLAAVRADGHPRGGRDRAARRRLRRQRRALPCTRAGDGEESGCCPDHGARLEAKRRARRRDEQVKPLAAYRADELVRSHECFFGDDRSYHEARHRFVHKLGAPCVVQPARPLTHGVGGRLSAERGSRR